MNIKNKIINLKNNKKIENSTIQIFNKIALLMLGIVQSILLSRYLDMDIYGKYIFAQSYIVLFSVFINLGFETIVVRELVLNKCNKNTMGTVFYLQLLGGIISFILILCSIPFIRPGESKLFFIVALLSLGEIFRCFQVIRYYFISCESYKGIVLSELYSRLTILLLIVIGIWKDAYTLYFIVTVSLVHLINAIGYYCFYRQHSKTSIKKWNFDILGAKRLLKTSLPLMLSTMAVTIHLRIDQIIIGIMSTDSQVAIYGIGTKFNIWGLIGVSVVNSFFPSLVKLFNAEQNKKFQMELNKVLIVLTVIAATITIGVNLFGEFIITLLYGIQYIESAAVLKILSYQVIFVYFGIVSGRYHILNGKTKFLAFRSFISAILNIVLNIIFIPIWGINGAAFATFLSTLVQGFILNIFTPYGRYLLKSYLNIFKLQCKRLK